MLNGEPPLVRSTASRSKTWFGRQHQAKQPAIKTPTEAMGVIATPLFAIHPPTEAGLLEALGDSHGIRGRDALEDLQGGVCEKSLQPRGC